MQPCGICVETPVGTADSVACSGPCGKFFHYSCVSLNPWQVSVPGLFWFCEDCRLEFNPAVKRRDSTLAEEIRKLSARIDSMDDNLRSLTAALEPVAQPQQNRVMDEPPTLPELPTEVWEKIFRNLTNTQLLHARQVCRHWGQVIAGSSLLLGKLTFRTPHGTTVDREYAPANLLLARSACFTRARISAVGSWWSSTLGVALTDLSISGCTLSLPTLVDLLRNTPNLKCFYLEDSHFSVDRLPEVDFRLDKMEHFALITKHPQVLDLFTLMFSKLKSFHIAKPYDERKVLQFVTALQDSLEAIEINPTAGILLDISRLERLRLKQIWFDEEKQLKDFDHRQLIEVSRLQPMLKILNLRPFLCRKRSYLRTIRELSVTLPRLKRLSLCTFLDQPLSFEFLQAFRELEHLELTGRWQNVELPKDQNPNMIEFIMSHVQPIEANLQHCLQAYPNLERLELISIGRVASWSNIFNPVQQMKSLRELVLEFVTVDSHEDDCLTEYFDNLKRLRLVHCEIPRPMLRTLLGLCPRVEEMYLHRRDRLDDEEVVEVCRKLQSLQKLTLSHVTGTSVDYIIEHCRTLEQLEVLQWDTQPAGARARLDCWQTTLCRVQRSM